MLGWSTCRLYHSAEVKEGEVLIPIGNSQHVTDGDQVRIVAGEWEEHARVTLDPSDGIEGTHVNNIRSAKWRGNEGESGAYERVGIVKTKSNTLRTNRRTQIGLFVAGAGTVLAYLAAATTKDGMVFWLSPWRWLGVFLAFVVALVVWYRDTLL